MRFRRSVSGEREDAEYDATMLDWGGRLRGSLDPDGNRAQLSKEVARHSDDLVYLLWAALARFVEMIDAELAPFHLTMERLNVLREIITARSPLDMTSLARRMSLSRSTIGGLFRRLDADDYAYQIVLGYDQRTRMIEATAKGHFVAAAACTTLDLASDRLTSLFSGDEMSALRAALTALADPRNDLRRKSVRSRSARLRCEERMTADDSPSVCADVTAPADDAQSGSRLCSVVGISSLTVGCACTARAMTV